MENKKKKTNTGNSYGCDFRFDSLPEGARVILLLSGQRVPHADHVVSYPQRQTPRTHGGEGQGVDKPTQGGKSPAALQRGQIPAFNLGNKRLEVVLISVRISGASSSLPETHLSVHGGADEQLSAVLRVKGAHVEHDPVVVLTLRGRPEQTPPLLSCSAQVPEHQLATDEGHRYTPELHRPQVAFIHPHR